MTRVSHGIDRIDATFDDSNLVANAGLLLVAKGDRVLRTASTEGRYPFLDEKVVEFCSQIAPDYKLRGRTDKWLLRQVAERVAPQRPER